MSFISFISIATNLILGYCLTMFYIYLYGDHSKVVHKWKFVGHWSLKMGLIGMILGIVINIWNADSTNFYNLLFDIGMTLVFLWAYKFHKQLFKNKIK